jgi:hypothetical protein
VRYELFFPGLHLDAGKLDLNRFSKSLAVDLVVAGKLRRVDVYAQSVIAIAGVFQLCP